MAKIVKLKVMHQWQATDLFLDGEIPGNQIQYLPWGKRPLKIKVYCEGMDEPLFLCPENVYANGRIAGYIGSQENPEVEISWGGGNEAGFELQKSEIQYAYFNITHCDKELKAEYRLKLLVITKTKALIAEIEIRLCKPSNLPANILKPSWVKTASDESVMHLIPLINDQVVSLPFYVSRWWPRMGISYSPPISDVPIVGLKCKRGGVNERSQISLILNEIEVAEIAGDLDFPLVDRQQVSVDLFAFASFWGVRVWFNWLDKRFPAQYLNSLTQPERNHLNNWGKVHEIPDAERVDLILDDQFDLRYVGTDIHWREMWGEPLPLQGDERFRIVVGGENTLDTIARGIRTLSMSAMAFVPRIGYFGDPSPLILNKLLNPLPPEASFGVGSIEHKHAPSLDAIFDSRLTSGDVLTVI